jgi:hypothetical protein
MSLLLRSSVLSKLGGATGSRGAPRVSVGSLALQGRGALVQGVLAFCLFEAAFYFAYRYGMSFNQAVASPFWFPDSVLLCALLLTRRGLWPIFVLSALPIRLFSEVARDIPLWFLLATYAIARREASSRRSRCAGSCEILFASKAFKSSARFACGRCC